MLYPQGNFHSQGNFGYPQGSIGQQGFQGAANGNGIPFANTLYGYPQLTPFLQGIPQSNWQHPAQQLAQLQTALQQQAMAQLLAPQVAPQPFALQNPLGSNAFNSFTNGTAQSAIGSQQPQVIPDQNYPALQPQSQQHLLQRLVQYRDLVAQQLAVVTQQLVQLMAPQTVQNSGYNFAGQFIPGQSGATFIPGVTTH